MRDRPKEKESEEWKNTETIWHEVITFKPTMIEKMSGRKREQDQARDQAQVSRDTVAHDDPLPLNASCCVTRSPAKVSPRRAVFNRAPLPWVDTVALGRCGGPL